MAYTKGLHQIGDGTWAYLTPDGGWGASNAGLVRDGEASLLVDTLFDLTLTREMLADMQRLSEAPMRFDILVNTHADGDHTYGNQLVGEARIISSEATRAEFSKVPPEFLHKVVTEPDLFGEGGRYVARWMGPDRFDFTDIRLTPPTETFEREMSLKVGDKSVRLFNVGPAHTAGDTLVHVVEDRVLYTGDLLFLGVHPAIWDGSFQGWLDACDTILELDVDTVVPGHGNVTDKAGVRLYRDYMTTLRSETQARFDAGMGVLEAALDLSLGDRFSDWISPERTAGSVNFLYREFGSPDATDNQMEILTLIGRYATLREQACADGRCGHDHH